MTEVRFARVKQGPMVASVFRSLLFRHCVKIHLYCYEPEVGKFVLTTEASPSDYENLMAPYSADDYGSGENSAVVALYQESGNRVGIFAHFRESGNIGLCSFIDTDSFDTTECVLVQAVRPLEVFVTQDMSTKKSLMTMLKSRLKLLVTVSGTICKEPRKILEKYEKIIDKRGYDPVVLERDERLSIIAGSLLPMNTEAGKSLMTLQILPVTNHMKVSHTTLQGLNIMGEKSLLKVLNHTRTPGGSRMLQKWLLQPLLKVPDIQRRLDMTELFVDNCSYRKMLHDTSLRKIPDFDRICYRLERRNATLKDLLAAYTGLLTATEVLRSLHDEDRKLLQDELLTPLSECLRNLKSFSEMIEKTVDFKSVQEGDVRIRPSFDADLEAVCTKMDSKKSDMRAMHGEEAATLGMDQKTLKLESNVQTGHYYRVTLKDERQLRKRGSTLMILETTKAGVKFRTKKLDKMNREYLDMRSHLHLLQCDIVKEIMDVSMGYSSHFKNIQKILSYLDCVSIAR